MEIAGATKEKISDVYTRFENMLCEITNMSDPNSRFYYVMLKRYKKQLLAYIEMQKFEKVSDACYKMIGIALLEDIDESIISQTKSEIIQFSQNIKHLTKDEQNQEIVQNLIKQGLFKTTNVLGIPCIIASQLMLKRECKTGGACISERELIGMIFYVSDIEKYIVSLKHELSHVLFEVLLKSGIIDLPAQLSDEPELLKYRLIIYFIDEFLAYNSSDVGTYYLDPNIVMNFDIVIEDNIRFSRYSEDEVQSLKIESKDICDQWSRTIKKIGIQNINFLKKYLLTDVHTWEDLKIEQNEDLMLKVKKLTCEQNA
jgi:hypothetical protein